MQPCSALLRAELRPEAEAVGPLRVLRSSVEASGESSSAMRAVVSDLRAGQASPAPSSSASSPAAAEAGRAARTGEWLGTTPSAPAKLPRGSQCAGELPRGYHSAA